MSQDFQRLFRKLNPQRLLHDACIQHQVLQLRLAGTVVREVLASRHFAARVTGNRLGVLMISIGPTELIRRPKPSVMQGYSGVQPSW